MGPTPSSFSKNPPLGRFLHRVTMSVCLLSPSHAIFFEAPHWPSGHMIRSRPLICQPSPLRPSKFFFSNSTLKKNKKNIKITQPPQNCIGPTIRIGQDLANSLQELTIALCHSFLETIRD